jgi:predicted lipoprotein with Yx(FWY)xxD motif
MVGEALATVSPVVGEAIETLASPAVVSTLPAGTTASTAEIPVTGGVTIQEEVTETHGSILVGEDGTPVYLYTNDIQNGGTSACTDAECAAEWPPVTTVGMPVAGTGVMQSLLGMITREDGTVQATYNGWPLYYSASGSLDAHGDEGTWFLVTAAGEAVPD